MIYAIFFLSGVSALMFENIWFRQAGLVLGNSVWASSLVLSSFMAGLAIGNAFAALRPVDRGRALRRYALLELIVGITGVGVVVLLPALGRGVVASLAPAIQSPAILSATRFLTAFAFLLVPTAAMGMTLPVLVGRAPSSEVFGVTLGRLYGWNTLGAVLGALAGEAFIYEWIGVRGAGLTAGALNLIAAALSLGLVARGEVDHASPGRAARPTLSSSEIRLLLMALLGGGLFLALEVVWTRFLLLFVFGTALTFAIMLAVTLTGLGIGGLLAARAPALVGSSWSVPALGLLAGLSVTGSYVGFNEVLALDLGALPGAPWSRLSVLAMALILPTALCSGALFTSIGVALERTMDGARATGLLSFFNTSGAALGALAAGFLLLPNLGLERSFHLLVVGYGAGALLSPGAFAAVRSAAGVLVAATYVAFTVLFPTGLMEKAYLRRAWAPFMAQGVESRVTGFREGTTETISYIEDRFQGHALSTRLVTNGFSMSGTLFFGRRYMEAFVYLPVAIHPRVERALLISYGVGVTARALTQTREIKSIDVVDISRDILAMAPLAFPGEASPLADPRVVTHIEDGRFFLQTATAGYDLITSEPPPPHLGGVLNLYTREYFDLVRSRLNPGGVVSYWLPVASLSDSDSQAISSAFCGAFPDCTLWKGMNLDWILLGTRELKTAVSEERFRAQWGPDGPQDLRRLGLERPEELGALYMGDPLSIPELTSAPPLTDNFPGRLSRTPPLEPPIGPWRRRVMDTSRNREAFARSAFIRAAWPEAMRSATMPFFDLQAYYDSMLFDFENGGRSRTPKDAVALLRSRAAAVAAASMLGSSPDMQILVTRLEARGGVNEPWYHAHIAIRDMADGNFRSAINHFRTVVMLAPTFPGVPERLAMALCLGGDPEAAAARAKLPTAVDASWREAIAAACTPPR